jgi:hypothetical protein
MAGERGTNGTGRREERRVEDSSPSGLIRKILEFKRIKKFISVRCFIVDVVWQPK